MIEAEHFSIMLHGERCYFNFSIHIRIVSFHKTLFLIFMCGRTMCDAEFKLFSVLHWKGWEELFLRERKLRL